jgi:23S rRNA pseudouridine1911/1915/1917 synthase
MRLDQALAAHSNISRRKARELIATGRVTVNQRPVRVASREVGGGEELAVVEALPSMPLLASGDDWLAVDKPAGMPSQPARDRGTTSLEEMLRVEHRSIYLVHRLDTPTSGVMLFARTAAAAARLSRLFAEGEVRKVYLAAVDPPLAPGEAAPLDPITIDEPIDGKEALTIATPLPSGLLEVEIKTGRTHQIRRHLAAIGHPVAGDRRYGGASAPRLMLHAWKLSHPSLGTIVAPPPFLAYDPRR